MVKQLVLDKAKEGAFFSKGCGTALVNIIKSCNEMQYCDAEFLDCILGGLQSHFEELSIPWMTIFLRHMAQLRCDDRAMILRHFVIFATETH